MSANDNESTNEAGADEETPLEKRLDTCIERVNKLIKRNDVLLDEIDS